ncbi:MAG: GNAT family N-acetyltransferase [Actinomycetota bacterium]
MGRSNVYALTSRDNNDEIILRDALASDARAIAAIHVRSFRATYRNVLPLYVLDELDTTARARIWAQRITDTESDNRRIVVAKLGDSVVGFVYFGITPDEDDFFERTGHVFSIHTDPEVTGRGVGTSLIQFAAGAMRATACQDATLWVVAENPGARQFYERLGWRADGARRTELIGLAGEPGAERDAETVRYRLQLRSEL